MDSLWKQPFRFGFISDIPVLLLFIYIHIYCSYINIYTVHIYTCCIYMFIAIWHRKNCWGHLTNLLDREEFSLQHILVIYLILNIFLYGDSITVISLLKEVLCSQAILSFINLITLFPCDSVFNTLMSSLRSLLFHSLNSHVPVLLHWCCIVCWCDWGN